jgi:hypothetical protein
MNRKPVALLGRQAVLVTLRRGQSELQLPGRGAVARKHRARRRIVDVGRARRTGQLGREAKVGVDEVFGELRQVPPCAGCRRGPLIGRDRAQQPLHGVSCLAEVRGVGRERS